MVKVSLRNITKRFGEVVAADHITLDIQDGEFFTFLGPSGCGKTTTLRIIAGLEVPDEGRVLFDDIDVTDWPPHKRGVGMVFQNYALWPHMSVFDNIAYGLKIRKIPQPEIKNRVKEVLELVRLEGLENRYPHQLSGGQQQRVALARALVVEPKLLLLDEPLSNLDAKLRIEMREELKELQRRLGITTIYVTHDQEEAMVLSDRIAIMNNGRVEQVGTPQEVYRRPKNLFVATFIGRSSVLEGVVTAVGDFVEVKVGELEMKGLTTEKINVGDKVYLVLRPHDFMIRKEEEEVNELEGVVEWMAFIGGRLETRIGLDGGKVLISLDEEVDISLGGRLRVFIPWRNVIVLKA